MATTYTCSGSVRGCCGVTHRTIDAARRCCDRDQRGCASLGGGAYSDRSVVASDGGETRTWDEQCDAADFDRQEIWLREQRRRRSGDTGGAS